MLNGWTPSYETTYTYDDDGRLTSSITRQIESEFDDATRNRILGMSVHDRQVCPGCGLHESKRDDPDFAFTFEERVCKVCEAQDVYARMLVERDEKAFPATKKAPPKDLRPTDGRHVYLRQMSPLEVMERQAAAAPPKHRRRDRA